MDGERCIVAFNKQTQDAYLSILNWIVEYYTKIKSVGL